MELESYPGFESYAVPSDMTFGPEVGLQEEAHEEALRQQEERRTEETISDLDNGLTADTQNRYQNEITTTTNESKREKHQPDDAFSSTSNILEPGPEGYAYSDLETKQQIKSSEVGKGLQDNL